MEASSVLIAILLFHSSVGAFVPKAFLAKPRQASSLHALSPDVIDPLVSSVQVADELGQATQVLEQAGEGLFGILKFVLAIFAVISGLLIFFATIVIPNAAAQLEVQIKEKYPDLWAEFEKELEEGETLAMRPDLINELGRKVQERDLAMFKQEQAAAEGKAVEKQLDDGVMDVEIVKKEPKADD